MVDLLIYMCNRYVKEQFWPIMVVFLIIWALVAGLMQMGVLKTKRKSFSGILYVGGLSFALAFVLVATLWNREVCLDENHFELQLFWSYRKFLTDEGVELRAQILGNILLFVPVGFLLPVNFKRFEKIGSVVMAAATLSLIIELIQGFAMIGLCEFDDVFSNTVGALTGVLVYRGLKSRRERRLMERYGI